MGEGGWGEGNNATRVKTDLTTLKGVVSPCNQISHTLQREPRYLRLRVIYRATVFPIQAKEAIRVLSIWTELDFFSNTKKCPL